MVAYSFHKEFAPLILLGHKRQTVRAHRRRHARPGEAMQLFTGMRTRHCRKIIPDPLCIGIDDVRFDLTALADLNEPESAAEAETLATMARLFIAGTEIDSFFGKQCFAEIDGFRDMIFRGTKTPISPLCGMVLFWVYHYGPVDFYGLVIRWEAQP